MSRAIATLFGAGFFRYGPGTLGSALAVPLAWLIHWAGGFPALVMATIIVTVGGWQATQAYIADGPADADPSEVVIDEVAGQFIALWPLSFGMMMVGAEAHVFPYPGWVSAFIFFRLFDIWKPGPVGWADGLHGATGIMLDDLIAGAMAAVCVVALAAIAHGVMA